MKVMIAYDGSRYADAAVNDVYRAGLPPNSEMLVVAVMDLSAISPPLSEFDLHSIISRRASVMISQVKAHNQTEIEKVKKSVSKVGKLLHSRFSEGKIRNEVLYGRPTTEILRKALEWNPDLIVVGSHGRTSLRRFFLGSVSQEVAEKANCSVCVVRQGFKKELNAANKIIIGASSILPNVEEVVRAVGTRQWAEDTEIRLVVVDDGISAGRVSAVYPYAKAIFEQSIEELRLTGAQVSVEIKSGETESILLEEAENWKADSIFVADERANKEKRLGNLAASLITEAKCTVEIVK